MKAIRSENTRPEMIVRKLLFSAGFRYRLHKKSLPGKPDIVLSRWNVAIFVNGCFWHGHNGCPRATLPIRNAAYWLPKLARNKERDREEQNSLLSLGWRVLVVWECACKKSMQAELQKHLANYIRDEYSPQFFEIGKDTFTEAGTTRKAIVDHNFIQ